MSIPHTEFPVCRLCFKKHDDPCTSFMAQQLRAKGRMEVGQAVNPISLACPQCAAKDAEVVRLKREVDGLLLQRDQKPKYGSSGRIDPAASCDQCADKDQRIADLEKENRLICGSRGPLGPRGPMGTDDVPRETSGDVVLTKDSVALDVPYEIARLLPGYKPRNQSERMKEMHRKKKEAKA